jgi:hypothetical protein
MATKSIIEIIKNIRAAQEAINGHSCNGPCPLRAAICGLEADVSKLVEDTKGLCLDCVNAGHDTPGLRSTPPSGSLCRVNHG